MLTEDERVDGFVKAQTRGMTFGELVRQYQTEWVPELIAAIKREMHPTAHRPRKIVRFDDMAQCSRCGKFYTYGAGAKC